MDVSEFADGPAQSQLLTKDESFAILLNISSVHTKYPLPDGFSKTRIPRINPSKKIVSLSCKLYVQRTICNPIVQINNGNLMDSMHFITNDNITLLGIQVRESDILVSIVHPAREDIHDYYQISFAFPDTNANYTHRHKYHIGGQLVLRVPSKRVQRVLGERLRLCRIHFRVQCGHPSNSGQRECVPR